MKKKITAMIASVLAVCTSLASCGGEKTTQNQEGLPGSVLGLIVGGIIKDQLKDEDKKEEEKKPETAKTLDESCFDGTYLPVTTEKAKAFMGNLKNVQDICGANWWNEYIDKNGARIALKVAGASAIIDYGYALKNESGFSLGATVNENGQTGTVYGDDTAIYLNIGGVKEKFSSDVQTDGYWAYLGIFDFFGVWGCYVNPALSTRPDLAGWVPERVVPYVGCQFAYYMDETDDELIKVKMVITDAQGVSSDRIFICQNGDIVALSKGYAEGTAMLLPWTGKIEKPTDLDTYTHVNP